MGKQTTDFRYNTGATRVPWAAVGENKYKIMQAPTLVEIRNGVANVIANASNIRTYAEKAN